MFDETDIEKLHEYVYFDTIYIEDEYETVAAVLIEIAKEMHDKNVQGAY